MSFLSTSRWSLIQSWVWPFKVWWCFFLAMLRLFDFFRAVGTARWTSAAFCLSSPAWSRAAEVTEDPHTPRSPESFSRALMNCSKPADNPALQNCPVQRLRTSLISLTNEASSIVYECSISLSFCTSISTYLNMLRLEGSRISDSCNVTASKTEERGAGGHVARICSEFFEKTFDLVT